MNLFDIIDKQKWQRMQDGFCKTLGINIQTLDVQGRPLPGINKAESLCFDVIRLSDNAYMANSDKCLSGLIDTIRENNDKGYQLCQLGLYLYGVPIGTKEMGTLGYMVAGPVMVQKKKNFAELKNFAREHKIDLDLLTARLSDFKKFSFVGIESAMELLHEVANDIVQLSYDTRILRGRLHIPKDLDTLVKDLYSSVYFEELLNALLEISLHTTKGSTGSIMILNHDKNELTVKFSHGLKDEVTKNSRVKVGDGISGIVAERKKPLLIDSSLKDQKIKKWLKRPQIKSSIVYPLEIKNRLFGVLNINNTGKDGRFNEETLDLVGNLAHLANIALGMFPKKTASDLV